MLLAVFLVSILSRLTSSRAQDYSIPLQWVNTTSSLSRDVRVQFAEQVFDSLSPSYDSSSGQIQALGLGQNANLLSATAIFDSIVSDNETKNYNVTTDRLSRAKSQVVPAQGLFSNDPLMWGLTAIYAYRAYKERSFLDDAVEIWQAYTPWVISPADAASGSHPLKTTQFSSECNGSTVAGGVFFRIDEGNKGDVSIMAGSDGAYMALSAYLYDITSNQTYYDATIRSRDFMQSHLYNTSGGYIVDSFNPATCGYAGSAAVTYKMGLYLEALSVFADTTSNSTLFQLADQLALNAIKSSIWVNTDGVLSDATAPKNVSDNSNFDTAYKGILVRALYEHWTRNQRDSSIANLIKAFLLVQYNAVLNLARYPGTSWYTQSWTGPPVPSLLPWGQLAAADLLNSAVGLAAEPSPIPILSSSSLPSATGSSPPNASSDSNPNSHTPIGAIVGGAVGGFLFAALLSVLLLFIRWRRRKANSTPNQHPSSWYRDQPITRGEGTPELYSRSVEPFPPPLPAVDHFNSSKRSGTPQSSITVSQPPTQQTRTEHRDHLPTFEDNTSHDDSISDLLFRLNRAVANLSPLGTADESSTIEPPRYEHIT